MTLRRKEEVRVVVFAKHFGIVGVGVLVLTVTTAGKMGGAVIACITHGFVIVRVLLISGRSITENRRAVGACHQSLTRRANRNAATVATGLIAAYIGVIDK